MSNVKVALVPNIIEKNGKTVRENNMERQHNIPLGTLVEVDCDYINEHGLRLFVGNHERDCDGEPLYSLTFDKELVGKKFDTDTLRSINDPIEKHYFICDQAKFISGFGEDCLKIIS